VICPRCQIEHGQGPCPARLVLSSGLIIYPKNLAAHRKAGGSKGRRRWYKIARQCWLIGRDAPQLRGC
jgi:hypothetical protein